MSRTIKGSSTSGVSLTSRGDNPVSVVAGAVIDTTGPFAIRGAAGTAWTIGNRGTLVAASYGVTLGSGGKVTNGGSGAAAGQISGGVAGIAIGQAAGLVSNTGTVRGTGAQASGVLLRAGGQVVNGSAAASSALIEGGGAGVSVAGGAGTVTNRATIASTGAAGYGVQLSAGGTVSNIGAGAVILGDTGVRISGGAGRVSNDGRITARSGYGVVLAGAGSVANGSAADAAALITGGVELGSGSVMNDGTITGLASGQRGVYGSGVNGSLTVSNSGSIEGFEGVRAAGTLRLINGSDGNTRASVSGTELGVFAGTGGAVLNGGTIQSSRGIGVLLYGSATEPLRVINGSAANHAASIAGSESGVYLRLYGATYRGQVLVTNFGTIEGGAAAGVVLAAQSGGITLINAGRIEGNPNRGDLAVQFKGGDALLAIYPGAVFVGQVVADPTRSNTLDFVSTASTGRIEGIGTKFQGFQNLLVDPGARWSVAGGDTLVGGAGITLRPAATLTVNGTLDVGGSLTLVGTGTLDVNAVGVFEVGTAGGAAAGALTVDAGARLVGAEVVKAAVRDGGIVEASGGTLVLLGGATGSGIAMIDAASVLRVQSSVALGRVEFLASGHGDLQVAQGGGLGATAITGFGAAAGNAIDLLGFHAASLVYTTLDANSGLLDLTGAQGSHAMLVFSGGSYAAGQFHFTNGAGAAHITFG